MYNEIINLRATYFIDIDVMQSQVKTLLDSLSDSCHLKAIWGKTGVMNVMPDGRQIPTTKNVLKMFTEDDRFVVSIGPGRVDVLLNKCSEDDKLDTLEDFVTRANIIYAKVQKIYNQPIDRIALGCVKIFDMPVAQLDAVCTKYTPAMQESVIEWNIRRVFRREIPTDQNVQLNVASEVVRNFIAVNYESEQKDRILVSYDINTLDGAYRKTLRQDTISKFWDIAHREVHVLDSQFIKLIGESNES